jgi:plastocyanin
MSDGSADVSRRAFLRAGAGATAVSAATGTAAAQEGTDSGGGGGNVQPVWPSYVGDATDEGYRDLRGQSEVTIAVGPGGNFSFGPTRVWIDAGTTITFEWDSDFHNVVVESQPSGAGWEGSPGSTTYDTGYSFQSTLETGGMYAYYCQPHEGQGMKGAIAVGDGVETEQVGGGGGGAPTLPDSAKSIGVGATFAMAATLGLAYFFIKYGGDYGDLDEA